MAELIDEEMDMDEDDHVENMDMNNDSMEMNEHDMYIDEGGSIEPDEALLVMVPVGDSSTTVTFTLTEDMVWEWEIGCFQLGGVHYTDGMVCA